MPPFIERDFASSRVELNFGMRRRAPEMPPLNRRRLNASQCRMRTIVQYEQLFGSHARRGYVEMPGRNAEDSLWMP
jgi:hypothetical protein